MKLKIAFNYPIKFIPYRHHNTQHLWGSAEVEVEVREVTAGEAPVAFRVGNVGGTDNYGFMNHAFNHKKDGTPREIRSFDGRLYVETRSAEDLQTRVTKKLNDTEFGVCKAREEVNPHTYGDRARTDWTSEEIRRKHVQPLRSLEDDNGARVAEKLTRRAAQLLIVDGVTYQRCVEPVLKIERGKVKVSPRPCPKHIQSYSASEFYASTTMRNGMHFENLVNADTLLGMKGMEQVEMATVWEVVDPSWSKFDGMADDVFHASRDVHNILTRGANGLTKDGLEATFLLREALEDAKGRATPRLISALSVIANLNGPDEREIERLEFLTRRHERKTATRYTCDRKSIAHERLNGAKSDTTKSAAQAAAKVIDRWNARPGMTWAEKASNHSSFEVERCWVRELLSEGQIVDACAAARISPLDLLEDARNGIDVIEIGSGEHTTYGLATYSPQDGIKIVYLTDTANEAQATAALRGLVEGADAAIETSFSLVP